jgi:superfamily II helicase
METKVCRKCKEEKPLSEFNKNKGKKDGLHCWCRDCVKSYIKEYNKEKWLSRGAIKNPKFIEMSKAVAEIKELGFQVSICRSRDYFSLDNEQTGYMIIVWDVFSNFHPKLMTFSRQLKTLVAKES